VAAVRIVTGRKGADHGPAACCTTLFSCMQHSFLACSMHERARMLTETVPVPTNRPQQLRVPCSVYNMQLIPYRYFNTAADDETVQLLLLSYLHVIQQRVPSGSGQHWQQHQLLPA
jgi:hypothetical protein